MNLVPAQMTDNDRAHWLADKVPQYNDYTAEAMAMLRRLADENQSISKWQPIESAPLNGEHVLLWQKYADFPVIAYFSHRRNMWFAETEHYETNGDATVTDTLWQSHISHWMPLPPPPEC